ncbi:MAG: hypothetical protein J7K75_12730 [Desulfuromonas sp.]|nr:hypothetical protein [Desulfuromonas sp.]
MIVRLVLLFIFVFLGYTVFTALLRMLGGGSSSSSRSADPDRMVPCSQCGTYVPETEVIRKKIRGEHYQFCSKECLQDFKHKS